MSDDQSSKGLDQSSFSLKKDLPQSKYNLSYDSLIQMNKNYLQAKILVTAISICSISIIPLS